MGHPHCKCTQACTQAEQERCEGLALERQDKIMQLNLKAISRLDERIKHLIKQREKNVSQSPLDQEIRQLMKEKLHIKEQERSDIKRAWHDFDHHHPHAPVTPGRKKV